MEKKKQHDEEIDKSLQAIYVDNQPTSDFTRLDRSSSWYGLRVLCGILFVLGMGTMAAWTGMIWLQPLESQQASELQLKLDGPQEITLGEETTFTVGWKNEQLQTLSNVQLHLGFPQDFTPTSFDPAPDAQKGLLWNIGILPSQQEGKIVVKGVFLGALSQEQAWQAIGTYRTNHSLRDAQVLDTRRLSYVRTALRGVIKGEARVVAGDVYDMIYEVKNESSLNLDRAILRFTYPDGFIPSTTSTFMEMNDATHFFIPLPSLRAQTSQTIHLTGSFRPAMSGSVVFSAELGKQQGERAFVALHTTSTQVMVIPGDLNIHTVVNSSDTERSIAPGDLLRVSVSYQNTSPEHLKNVVLTLRFESTLNGRSVTGTSLLNWTALEDVQKGATNTRTRIQTIRYDQKNIPVLADIAPQAEGVIELTIPSVVVATGTQDAIIRVSSSASVTLGGSPPKQRTVQTPPVVLRYRTDAAILADARYFTEEGAPIGLGPLPPVVGKTTTYRIYWHLKKTIHRLEDVVVQAVLPFAVSWTGRVSSEAGEMVYTSSTRTVRWQINKVPETVDELDVFFDVDLTPQTLDAGRFANLLERISFDAKDGQAMEHISRVTAGLSTDLQNDEGARGKGVVKK